MNPPIHRLLTKALPISEQRWPSGTAPLVSVWCAAYQHELFLEKALDSFLMQETTFPVQIIVHDDASVDRTPDIIHEYSAKYPQIFTPIIQKENLLGKGVVKQLLPEFLPFSQGEFISYCDGDDYWLTTEKLQQQVEVMMANPDVMLCYHSYVEVDAGGLSLPSPAPRERVEIFDQGDFIRGMCVDMRTASVLYRRSLLSNLPSWYLDLPFGDNNLYALASLRGRIAVIPGVHSAYRRHSGGAYSKTLFAESDQKFLAKELWWNGATCDLYRHLANEKSSLEMQRLCQRRYFKESLESVWLARLVSDRKQMLHRLFEAAVSDLKAAMTSIYWWKHLCFALFPVLDINRVRHLQVCRQSRQIRLP